MTRRICLVTGASSGIGLATAEELARRGFELRIVGRNPARLERAAARTGGVPFRADLGSLDAVRELAAQVLTRDEPLHVLINNAGVWHPDFRRSADGFEDTFAVNVLAPFLLTELLLPRMRRSDGDRRVVNVASRVHVTAGVARGAWRRLVHTLDLAGLHPGRGRARLDLDAIDREEGYLGLEAYARSKLALIVLTNEHARRESEVTVNSLHPGDVGTDVTRDNPVLRRLMPIAAPFLETPAQGAQTSVFVATDPSLAGVTGRYYSDRREVAPADAALDADLGKRLYALCAERVGLA